MKRAKGAGRVLPGPWRVRDVNDDDAEWITIQHQRRFLEIMVRLRKLELGEPLMSIED